MSPSPSRAEERSPAYGWMRRTIYGGGGTAGAAWRVAAAPLARLWRATSRLRLSGRLRPPADRLPAPTVSVGNVTVGGSGKTSLVRWLVEEGTWEPAVAVLSRGYGRERKSLRVVPPGGGSESPREAGDEPLLLARSGAWVGVGPDRVRAAEAVAERARPAAFLLDDGLQHRRVARCLDLVCFLSEDLVAPARCLPAGPLRQGPEWRPPAAAWVVVGGDPRESAWPEGTIGSAFSPWWRELPGCVAEWDDAGTVTLSGWTRGREEPFEISTTGAVAIAGVARPGSVRKFAERAGWRVARLVAFPDHHPFGPADLPPILAEHPGRPILVTEKDAVKLDPAWFGGRGVGVLRRRLRPRDPELLLGLVAEALGEGR
ncbi:MAG: tetraacyldisaccharide 4'-kinase [Gemmatimonadota bacterium]|nr:tetraacyldisaccharide 4'-kinase [Gemmatimonadota bacterium]